MMIADAWWWWAGGLLGAVGVALLLWALLADRARGRPRCARCGYDLLGTVEANPTGPWTCAECGRAHPTRASTLRTRRRWGWASLATCLLLLAAGLAATPAVLSGAGVSHLPTRVLLWMLATHAGTSASRALVERELSHRLVVLPPNDPSLARIALALVRVQTRPSWPRGLPIWVRVERMWGVTRDQARVASARRDPRDASDAARLGAVVPDVLVRPPDDDRSYEPWWQPEANGSLRPLVGTSTPGVGAFLITLERTDLPGSLIAAASPSSSSSGVGLEERFELAVPVRLVDRVEEILEPRRGPEVDALVLAALKPALLVQPGSGRAGVDFSRAEWSAWPAGCAVGLSITIERAGRRVAWANGWLDRRGSGWPLFLAGDHATLLAANPDDPAWTVIIRGEGELALRDLEATGFWSGELRLPLRALWPGQHP